MSYCVNCGVKLHETAEFCPLCNCPVVNPLCPPNKDGIPPYPREAGMVDPVSKRGIVIFLSVLLFAISAACLLLNLLLFDAVFWSIFVIGGSLLLWIFVVPPMLLRAPLPVWIAVDGVATACNCLLIALQMQPENRSWFFELALPIIVLITLEILLFAFLLRRYKLSIATRTAILFGEIGVLSVGVELLIHHMTKGRLYLTWSAVVLTCCLIIVIAFVTVLCQSSLRETVRKRLHL